MACKYNNGSHVIVTAKSVNKIEYVEYDANDSKISGPFTYEWTQGYGIFNDNADPEKGNGMGYLQILIMVMSSTLE